MPLHIRTRCAALIAGSLLLLRTLAGCYYCPVPTSDNSILLFHDNRLCVEAESERVDTSRPILVTTSVIPTFTGKGRIYLGISDTTGRQRATILSPVHDSLPQTRPGYWARETWVPVTYTANQELTVPWLIHFASRDSFSVFMSAMYDSVYVADSARYYRTGSRQALRYMDKVLGFEKSSCIFIAARNGFRMYP